MKREAFDLSLSADLCSAPAKRVAEDGKRATRAQLAWSGQFEGLVLKKPDYERQYGPLYFSRLHQLRGPLETLVKAQGEGGKKSAPFRGKLIEVQLGEECWVVGTLFRDMRGRPSALDEYLEVVPPKKNCYAERDDTFIVEDETGRAALKEEGKAGELLGDNVTGLVVALRCVEQESGELLVKEVLHPGVAPLFKQPASSGSSGSSGAGLVGFVSGKLEGLKGEMLAEFLCGQMGAPRSTGLSASVARLVILGNAVGLADGAARGAVKHHHQALTAIEEANLLAPVIRLDAYLARLCGALPVDLLPGPLDPAAQCLPQQPLSPVLFPSASRWASFNCVTNPSRSIVGPGVELVCSGGQPVENLQHYSLLSPLDAACSLLRWRHLCPTAPDTLACYPSSEDPFVLSHSPHLLVFGNMPLFDSRRVQHSTVLLVPDFAETGLLVLYDPASGQVSTVSFAIRD